MRLGSAVMFSCVFLGVGSVASTARAQQSGWGDVAVSAVHIDYDLSGTGTAPGLAIRASRDLSPHVALEVRGLFANPEQQFGPSRLFVPEVQLQYRWRLARVSPYLGAGVGTSLVRSSVRNEWDPTISFAAGTAVQLTDRMALTGEFRLRGIEWRFTGTTAEWSGGLAWRLGSF